ncbi:MAG TPA: hypothetical protein VLB09_02490 [Nitrospiria bacterium]|nr:hypothetical protein [Nitrospiria bacterium]
MIYRPLSLRTVLLVGVGLGLVVTACGPRKGLFYSLKDPEVFRASSPHEFHVIVLRLRDGRPLNEIRWEREAYPPEEDILGRIGERMADHFKEAGIFRQVEYVDIRDSDREAGSSGLSKMNRDLAEERADFLLSGDLAHFWGIAGPGGEIEGLAGFEKLRLTRVRSGEVVWEGTFLKKLKRKEITPRTPHYYASEALRGALNKVTQSLSGQKLVPGGPAG